MSNGSIDYKSSKDAVIKKAETDPDFLAELKNDPKGAIEKHFSYLLPEPIPQKFNIVVVEDSEFTVFLNIVPPSIPPKLY